MVTFIDTTPAFFNAVLGLDRAFTNFIETSPFTPVDLTEIITAHKNFADTLPTEMVAEIEHQHNDLAYATSVDMEDFYSGIDFEAAWILCNFLSLITAENFASFAAMIEVLTEQLPKLLEFHPEYDAYSNHWKL